jgi:SMI1-KNR4 cell-wall
MWVEKIRALLPEATFAAPASDQEISACEAALKVELDADLVGLLREANGVSDRYGAGLIWPAERIAATNQMFRTNSDFADLYMPFDALLFFADAGNGDQFAFVLRDQRRDVFVWEHESDSRRWVAADLDTYLTWWLDGTISL